MKHQWDIEELIEHFTLVEEDLPILGNKSGSTRLECALLLKYFQHERRFPTDRHDIPKAIVDDIACQLKLDATLFTQYDWEGRMIKSHRAQLREQLGLREATAVDTEEMKSCLVAEKLASDQNEEHPHVTPYRLFRLDLSERMPIEESLSA